MKEVKVGVRDMAFHLYSDGDLTSSLSFKNALENGVKAHDFIQAKYNNESLKEVYIKGEIEYKDYFFFISGYIDGLLRIDGEVIIEEIKSTSRDLNEIDSSFHPEYLAQLKIYAYLYCLNNCLDTIKGRLLIINTDSYEQIQFNYSFAFAELSSFFENALDLYYHWIDMLHSFQEKKTETIDSVAFPFLTYRAGQRKMMSATYSTMQNNGILYVNAPTGIGKTISTLFSTIKTIKEPNEKIFYATAKSVHKQLAVDSIRLLNQSGLACKTILLTAKEKVCLSNDKICDTSTCTYAKGFFGKLRNATEEAFASLDCYTYEDIIRLSRKHVICPFEFSLHLSLFCDVIVGDYNYVFDPQNHLIRFFDEPFFSMKVLIDEAHNLVSRANDMYSAMVNPLDVIALRRLLRGRKPGISSLIKKFETHVMKIRDENTVYPVAFESINHETIDLLHGIHAKCGEIFMENPEFKTRNDALEKYFLINRFLKIAEYFADSRKYVIYKTDEQLIFCIQCLDASANILNTLQSIRGAVFFSATLTPFQYYKELLTKKKGDHLILDSPFPEDNLSVILVDSVNTMYKKRTESLAPIISVIKTTIAAQKGNYIVFFPSYEYMHQIYEKLDCCEYEVIVQQKEMTENDRNDIINSFAEANSVKLGLFVMGGVFSEGVDYLGDMLIGAIIVGTGIPQICFENELAREYFEAKLGKGFDYAYCYPGFNKVVQAAGRVIRSSSDKGIIVLVDSRLTNNQHLGMMPAHWRNHVVCKSASALSKHLKNFWNN